MAVSPSSDWNTAFNELADTTDLDATAAANVLADTSGLPLVGALNAYNGTTGLGLNAVCNAIAGTSGLEALDALRNGVWATVPTAPTLDSVTAGNTELDVVGTLGSDGGSAITDVEYRLDGGSWVSSGQSTGTFTITELSNGVEYDVEIRAVNSIGPSTGSNLISATPVSPNVNLLTANQASVETDTTGFSVTANATISASTDYATHGSKSLKVVKSSPGVVNVTLTQVTSGIVAGENHTVVVDNKCVNYPAASYYFKIDWYQSNGTFISQSTSTAKTYTADWIQNTYTVAAPALAARATIILNIYNPLGNGTYYYDKLGFFHGSDTTWTLPA